MAKGYRRVKKSKKPRRYKTRLPSSLKLGQPYKHITLAKRTGRLLRRFETGISSAGQWVASAFKNDELIWDDTENWSD